MKLFVFNPSICVIVLKGITDGNVSTLGCQSLGYSPCVTRVPSVMNTSASEIRNYGDTSNVNKHQIKRFLMSKVSRPGAIICFSTTDSKSGYINNLVIYNCCLTFKD